MDELGTLHDMNVHFILNRDAELRGKMMKLASKLFSRGQRVAVLDDTGFASDWSIESAFVLDLDPLPWRQISMAPVVRKDAQVATPITAVHDSDTAHGKLLVSRHGQNIHYMPESGWYIWNGRFWIPDHGDVSIQEMAKETALSLFDDVKNAAHRQEREEKIKHAKKAQSRGSIEASIKLARSEAGVPRHLTDMDADKWAFTVSNGTLDLRTCKLNPHNRDQLISMTSPVTYDEHSRCPLWLSFLDRVMAGDAELIGYLQRLMGYLLVADTSEQALHFFYGLGANGKSVFCDVILKLMGDYAQVSSPMLIMNRHGNGVPNDVARLRGVRASLMNETAQGARLDEAKVKDLTGGDKLSARFLNKEFFDFVPTHRLIIRGNHKPTINGTDDGIWRRLRLVPFTVSIPIAEQDLTLARKLEGELSGILNWALVGCMEWQVTGLNPPPVIADAVREYREESDTLGRFVSECCEQRKLAEIKSSALFKKYQEFCEQAGERWIPSKDFPSEMQRRGFVSKRFSTGVKFLGLELRSDQTHFDDERF